MNPPTLTPEQHDEVRRLILDRQAGINAVAKLLGVSWHTAQAVITSLGLAVARTKKPAGQRKPKRKINPKLKADLPAPEEPETCELTVEFETAKADLIFSRFSIQEKYDAICFILQRWLDKVAES